MMTTSLCGHFLLNWESETAATTKCLCVAWLEKSQPCPSHVLRTGTCPKIPGTESDDWPFLCNFCSVTCPWHVLAVSHVSSLPPVTKSLQIVQILQINLWKISLIPLQELSFPNSYFDIATLVLIPKEKIEVSIKYLHYKHEKYIVMHLLSFSPLAPLWSQQNWFFNFSFFDQISAHKIKLG